MYIIIVLIYVTCMYNLTLYYTLYNINTIRCITFRCLQNAGFSHTHRLSSSVCTQRIFVRAPNSWETSARTTTISCASTRKAIGLPPAPISLTHTCYTRSPPRDDNSHRSSLWDTHTSIVSSGSSLVLGASHHAGLVCLTHPTVRTAVLSRVRSTRVCARRRRIRRLT